MTWTLEHKKGDPIAGYGEHFNTLYSLPGYQGGAGYKVRNAHQISELRHVSGSGPLNGAKEWPHLTLDVAFPAGEELAMRELSARLRDFVEEWLRAHNLEVKGSCR